MPLDNIRRRNVLKKGALGGLLGLAGCAGQGGDGDDGDDGGGGTPEPETKIVERTVEKTKVVTKTVVQEPTRTPEADTEYRLVPEQNWLAQSRSAWPTGYEWALLARNQLERLGLRFNWNVKSVTAWGDDLFARNWDFTHIAWGATPDRIFPYYPMYFSFHSQFAEEGSGNFEMWASEEYKGEEEPWAKGKEEYDTLVDEFKGTPDDQDRAAIGNKLQFLQGINQPVLFTNHPDALAAVNTNLFSNWKAMFGNYPYLNTFTMRELEGGNTDTLVYGNTTPLQRGYPNFFTMAGTVHKIMYILTYDPLVRLDFEGAPQPAAAESFEYVDDQTVDVTLREGMTFHDGEPVTPEDVKFTWDYVSEQGIPEEKILYEPYDSAEIMGDNKIRFNLNFPYAGWTTINIYRIPILPKHIWEGITEKENLEHPRQWSNPDMTGSGPFEFVGFQRGSQLVLEVNDDHYWADQFDFDRFVYRIYGSQSSIVGDLGRGKVAFAEQLSATHWERASQQSTTNAIANPNIRTNGIWCRCDQEPFNDVRVRQALQHATNNPALGDLVFKGNSVPARSVIAPANKLYYNSDTPRMEPSLRKARQKLADAGLRWDDQGRLMMPVDWEPEVEYIGTDQM